MKHEIVHKNPVLQFVKRLLWRYYAIVETLQYFFLYANKNHRFTDEYRRRDVIRSEYILQLSDFACTFWAENENCLLPSDRGFHLIKAKLLDRYKSK